MRVAAQAHVFGLHVRAHPTHEAPVAERRPADVPSRSLLRSRIALLGLACLVAFLLGAAVAAVY